MSSSFFLLDATFITRLYDNEALESAIPRSNLPIAMAQTLPDDLLYLIFLLALPFTVKSIEKLCDPLTIPPLNFSAVCRSWRAVVVSQPGLWSSICIEHDRHPSLNMHPTVLRFVEKWLNNSERAPLKIRLKFQRDASDLICNELLAMILSQCHRWSEFEIYDSIRVSASTERTFTVQCMPSAISLRLRFDVWTSLRHQCLAFLDLSSCTNVGTVPRLRILHARSGVKWLFPERRIALYLPNLRELSLSSDLGANIDDTIRVLSACPNIETLCITVWSTIRTPVPASTDIRSVARTIVLPHLVGLELKSMNHSTSHYLLGHLSCPTLQKFDHHEHTDKYNAIPQHLHSFAAFLAHGCSASHPPLLT